MRRIGELPLCKVRNFSPFECGRSDHRQSRAPDVALNAIQAQYWSSTPRFCLKQCYSSLPPPTLQIRISIDRASPLPPHVEQGESRTARDRHPYHFWDVGGSTDTFAVGVRFVTGWKPIPHGREQLPEHRKKSFPANAGFSGQHLYHPAP